MTEIEVITHIARARDALKPLMDFIHAHHIVPKDGILSYCYGTANKDALRINADLTDLLCSGMALARETKKGPA